MKAIKEQIGNATILIQTIDDDDVIIIGEESSDRSTIQTGITDTLQSAYANVKSVIHEMAEDIGSKLSHISVATRPDSVEMAFNLGFSAKGGAILLLSGEGQYGLNVKITWNLDRNTSLSRKFRRRRPGNL